MLAPADAFFAFVCALFVVLRYAVTGFRAPRTAREVAHRRMIVPCLLTLLATRGHVLRSAALSLLVGFGALQFELLDGKRWISGTFLAFADWMLPYVAMYTVMYFLSG